MKMINDHLKILYIYKYCIIATCIETAQCCKIRKLYVSLKIYKFYIVIFNFTVNLRQRHIHF